MKALVIAVIARLFFGTVCIPQTNAYTYLASYPHTYYTCVVCPRHACHAARGHCRRQKPHTGLLPATFPHRSPQDASGCLAGSTAAAPSPEVIGVVGGEISFDPLEVLTFACDGICTPTWCNLLIMLFLREVRDYYTAHRTWA